MQILSPLKFFNLTIVLTGLILLSPIMLVAVFDPFFIYHKPWFVKVINPHNQGRLQNAGFIKNWLSDPETKIDTIFLGTSMSQNFPLDQNSLRLTLPGGRPLEIRYIAEKAISTGKVKNVIWEVYWPYILPDENETHPESPLPLYMYNNTTWDDWRYFVNADVVKDAVNVVIKPEKNRKPLAEIYTWGRTEYAADFEKFSSQENIRAMNTSILNQDNLPMAISAPKKQAEYVFPNIDKNLLPVLKANPDIRFMLYFPPSSYYGYLQNGSERFWQQMKMREALLKSVADMPNVTVYGFDLINGLGDTSARYKDSQHYDPDANQMMLNAMRNKNHVVTDENFPRYRQEFIRRLNDKYTQIKKQQKPD